jgi:hypothetical protein
MKHKGNKVADHILISIFLFLGVIFFIAVILLDRFDVL